MFGIALWEWLWVTVFLALIIGSVANEGAWVALVFTAILVLGLEYVFGSGIGSWLAANPGLAILYMLLYLAVGCGWSVVKWYLFVRKSMPEIRRAHESWKKKTTNAELKVDEFLASGLSPVTVEGSKARLVTWIAWWPASMLWTGLHDIVVELWDRAYEMTKGIYRAVLIRALS